MARIQPYVFAIGITVMSMAMSFMGGFGVPRRHWDITGTGAPFTVDFHPAVNLLQAVFGIGGLIAVLGALMFIASAVVTVFFGRACDAEAIQARASGIPQGVLALPAQTHESTMVARAHAAGTPGTVILAFVFLGCFVIYYFVNWKMLSFLWRIG